MTGRLRRSLTGLAAVLAALSLVGAGAGASFTGAVTAEQTVSTTRLDLRIAPTTKVRGVETAPTADSAYAEALTLDALADQGSTFGVARTVVVRNYDDVPVKASLDVLVQAVGERLLLGRDQLVIKVERVTADKGKPDLVYDDGEVKPLADLRPWKTSGDELFLRIKIDGTDLDPDQENRAAAVVMKVTGSA